MEIDKEYTKNMIRSILITNKAWYELPDFLRIFKERSGHDLPLFGYRTAIEFLRSIPETVQFVQIQEKRFLKRVDHSNISHITSIVKKENVVKKYGFGTAAGTYNEVVTRTLYKVDFYDRKIVRFNGRTKEVISTGPLSQIGRGKNNNKNLNNIDSVSGPSSRDHQYTKYIQ